MHTLTIKIAQKGTPYIDQKTGEVHDSSVGHMWYSISNGTETTSYGFAPDGKSTPVGPGHVTPHDDAAYQETYYTGTIVIAEEQYNTLKNWYLNPEYQPLKYDDGWYIAGVKDCIDFTWKALEAIGLPPSGSDGQWWPAWNAGNADEILFKALNSSSPEEWNEEQGLDARAWRADGAQFGPLP